MFSGIGTFEILIILFIILLLFGAKKLPELAKGLGKGIKEFKKASNDIKEEVSHFANQFSKYVVDRVVRSQYVPNALEFIKHSYGNYKLFISTGTPTTEMKNILKLKKIIRSKI